MCLLYILQGFTKVSPSIIQYFLIFFNIFYFCLFSKSQKYEKAKMVQKSKIDLFEQIRQFLSISVKSNEIHGQICRKVLLEAARPLLEDFLASCDYVGWWPNKLLGLKRL